MPGEALKLPRDSKVWRILEESDGMLKLIFDCRKNPKFRWIYKSSLAFSQRHWISWPVYTIDGAAKAIRHTNFAPGDLYLDDRTGEIVRPLSGKEKWRLTGLSDAKRSVLQAGGLESELGQLAGNSIPCNMTRAVAEDEAQRIARYKNLLSRREAGTFTPMPPVAGLYTKTLCATFLLFMGISQAEVLVWNSCEIPGMVHDVSQQQAFDQACGWSRQLGCATVDHCVILECDMGASRARTVIIYVPSTPHILSASRVKISALMHLPVGELAVRALSFVERMAKVVIVEHCEASGWQSGRVSGSVAYQTPDASAAAGDELQAFLKQAVEHEESVTLLRTLLTNDASADILHWEQRLLGTDLSDFPESLKRPQVKLTWSQATIHDPHQPAETEWQPLPAKVHLPVRPAPNVGFQQSGNNSDLKLL